MARRVVRPSKAPYLLIAFIVLTVGSATGLAIFANLYFELRLKSAGLKRIEKAKGKYDPVQRLLNRVKKDNLIDVIEEFEKLADLHKTSIYKLSDQLGGDPHAEQSGDQLNQSVNTDVADIEGVLEEAGRALRRSLEIPGAEGKAPEMTHAKAAVLLMQTRIEELGTLLVQKETERKNRLAEIQQMSQKIKTQSTGSQKNIDRIQAELTAEQGRFREARQRLINQNTGLKDERDQVLARLEGERKTWGRERDKLGTAAETLRSQIRELSDMIAKFRVLADEVDIDGTIVDVSEEKGAAYISLAKGDAILNGMT
ncbi:MAG: hypothetical protein QF662_04725, partial [Phycisphaerae bacterium]|nr:hypothetical protein [Phycisphaerae bacterium]